MRDYGAQPERTRLAWRRTALTATVVFLLAIRNALHDGVHPFALLLVAALALAWVALLCVIQLRIRALAASVPLPMRSPMLAFGIVFIFCLLTALTLVV